MQSPIYWFGGKGEMTNRLLPLLPPHTTYVEAFGGGASLLFAKKPSPVEVYNDRDGGLVNFFRVLRDPFQFEEFYDLVQMTPWARKEYEFCRRTWEDVEDPVVRAYRFFVTAKMSFSGKLGDGWASVVESSRHGMAGTCSRWRYGIEGLPEVHQRLMQVQVEGEDWERVLTRYDRPGTLFYLDPPYHPDTRRRGGYRFEMTTADHCKLIMLLWRQVQGMVVLSGYFHPLYAMLEGEGWVRHEIKTSCRATGRTQRSGVQGEGSIKDSQARIECVWLNPAALARLGD